MLTWPVLEMHKCHKTPVPAFNVMTGGAQDDMSDGEQPSEEAMRRVFSLAAQYIALAYSLQPRKDVYAKSIQVRSSTLATLQ